MFYIGGGQIGGSEVFNSAIYICLKAINMEIYYMYYFRMNGVDLSELELSTIIWDYLLVYIIYRRGIILLNMMVKIYKI